MTKQEKLDAIDAEWKEAVAKQIEYDDVGRATELIEKLEELSIKLSEVRNDDTTGADGQRK